MNQEKRILVCEDSMEGIFSAVYDGWKECAGHLHHVRQSIPR